MRYLSTLVHATLSGNVQRYWSPVTIHLPARTRFVDCCYVLSYTTCNAGVMQCGFGSAGYASVCVVFKGAKHFAVMAVGVLLQK